MEITESIFATISMIEQHKCTPSQSISVRLNHNSSDCQNMQHIDLV